MTFHISTEIRVISYRLLSKIVNECLSYSCLKSYGEKYEERNMCQRKRGLAPEGLIIDTAFEL